MEQPINVSLVDADTGERVVRAGSMYVNSIPRIGELVIPGVYDEGRRKRRFRVVDVVHEGKHITLRVREES